MTQCDYHSTAIIRKNLSNGLPTRHYWNPPYHNSPWKVGPQILPQHFRNAQLGHERSYIAKKCLNMVTISLPLPTIYLSNNPAAHYYWNMPYHNSPWKAGHKRMPDWVTRDLSIEALHCKEMAQCDYHFTVMLRKYLGNNLPTHYYCNAPSRYSPWKVDH